MLLNVTDETNLNIIILMKLKNKIIEILLGCPSLLPGEPANQYSQKYFSSF